MRKGGCNFIVCTAISERKLFVGMISRKCNEAEVRNMFSRFGVIDECTVLRDNNQQSKGKHSQFYFNIPTHFESYNVD